MLNPRTESADSHVRGLSPQIRLAGMFAQINLRIESADSPIRGLNLRIFGGMFGPLSEGMCGTVRRFNIALIEVQSAIRMFVLDTVVSCPDWPP